MTSSERAEQILGHCVSIAVQQGASDIHLSPGAPMRIRLHGFLKDISTVLLTTDDTEAVMRLLLSRDFQDEVTGPRGDADFAMTFEKYKARFRGNVFRTTTGLAIALRYLPEEVPSLEKLGLPSDTITQRLLGCQQGLVLVTGPTGSGKSTTLAAMINYLATKPVHIITVEAPVEYQHNHAVASIDQRQVPADTPEFGLAVRAALREDPDVIMVGEMRDLETIQTALTAAETGHLVLSTLHTSSAAETIDRIVDVFPSNLQAQIRTQLAMSLVAVISQRLVPLANGQGRIAAFELMIVNTAIRAEIRDRKTVQIPSAIETGFGEGMVAFDNCLAGLVRNKVITVETAMQYVHSPKDFVGRIGRR